MMKHTHTLTQLTLKHTHTHTHTLTGVLEGTRAAAAVCGPACCCGVSAGSVAGQGGEDSIHAAASRSSSDAGEEVIVMQVRRQW